ncbi:MAG: lipopolysaccharide kinase InaA family protein [Candidatus Bathyarchaeia archaeon]
MIKKASAVGNSLNFQIVDFCRRIAGTATITAVSLLDNNMESSGTPAELIIIIKDYPPRLLSLVKSIGGKIFIIFAVDQWIFERDVEKGFLGEALASVLLFDYTALYGQTYLHDQEILLKKRLILELLSNLALSFSELACLIQIKPQYFMYEVILNRIRVFPPMVYGVSHFFRGELSKNTADFVLNGYIEALKQLEQEKKVILSNGYVMVPRAFVSGSRNPRTRLANISKNAPRTLFTSLFGLFPQLLNFLSRNTEALLKFKGFSLKRTVQKPQCFVDPQKFIFIPTAQGFVSLADKTDIKTLVQKLYPKSTHVKVERVGGVLNDVYLVRVNSNNGEIDVLVKRFRDWSGFKWFPLTLWSLGTKTFTVMGRYRLESECAISEFLRREGFNVPKILCVNHNGRLLFMEYIKGESLVKFIKRIAAAKNKDAIEKEFALIQEIGRIHARVHALNFGLGDTKPENVIVDTTGKIYLIDFEQAAYGGDKSWDVAEFLYYSGHYLPPLNSAKKAALIANAFITGYLEAGGDVQVIKNAAAPKYTRVFSIFTPPAAVLAISDACRKADKQG